MTCNRATLRDSCDRWPRERITCFKLGVRRTSMAGLPYKVCFGSEDECNNVTQTRCVQRGVSEGFGNDLSQVSGDQEVVEGSSFPGALLCLGMLFATYQADAR